MDKTYIPYGAYWSTPFCRWQGALAGAHSMELAASTARSFFERRQISTAALDGIVLGLTVPQRQSFYGAPWLAGMIGVGGLSGTMVSQACATSTRMIVSAALEVEAGARECMLTVACDRTSNGPHTYYPAPAGVGGTGEAENPVLDNFNLDPNAGGAMIDTAENVAREAGISREEQDDVTVMRHEQYAASLADERAFQRRYMHPVELMRRKKVIATIETDEGIHPTTREGLAGLRPLKPEGTVTFGGQTYPADGNAGIIVCTRERAKDLSPESNVTVQILSYGESRVKKGFMPTAPVPAAQQALERAGIGIEDCKAIKTHNPFAVNDIYFSRETGVALDKMNNFGSPLIFGHPQGPTGARVIIELIEELATAGGGHGLFTGCAAGDTGMALVVKVSC